MTEFLLQNNAEMDARTYGEEQTAMHYAAKNGAAQSLEVLLGFQGNIDSLDGKKKTPLQVTFHVTVPRSVYWSLCICWLNSYDCSMLRLCFRQDYEEFTLRRSNFDTAPIHGDIQHFEFARQHVVYLWRGSSLSWSETGRTWSEIVTALLFTLRH